MTGDDKGMRGESLHKARQRWWQLHDQQTGGIPGLFPLVPELPVQFTNTYAREDHIFKFTRGCIWGWELQPLDAAIVEGSSDPELILNRLPKIIYVEVKDAVFEQQAGVPAGVYPVKPRNVFWSRDKAGNAKVRRTGFLLVPSFSGTAHSYTGATLPKAIVDCLSFCSKPTQEDMTKSYVCISRVRSAVDLLIAQPFSPALFQQGIMAGLHLRLHGRRKFHVMWKYQYLLWSH